MEYRITDNESKEAVFGNAEQYISDVKENWMYMGTFSGMDEFKHWDTREVRKIPSLPSEREIKFQVAYLELADIFRRLTETDEHDEEAFAEFCGEAEGFLEDWLDTRNQKLGVK